MTQEKQIEEMIKILHEGMKPLKETYGTNEIASILYNAGYRKQSEGEWISNHQTDEFICNLCGAITPVDCEKERFYKSNFCPNCGAKMKGGE